jgi:hypothetical protein
MAGVDRFRWGGAAWEEEMAGVDRFWWGRWGNRDRDREIETGVSMSFYNIFTWSGNHPSVYNIFTWSSAWRVLAFAG